LASPSSSSDKSSSSVPIAIPVIVGIAVGIIVVVLFSIIFSSTGAATGSYRSVFDFQNAQSENLKMDIHGMPKDLQIGAALQPIIKIKGTVTGCAPPPYAEVRDMKSNEAVWNSGLTTVFCYPGAGPRSVTIDWVLGNGYVENGVYHPQPNKNAMVAERTGRYELTIEYAALKESKTFDVISTDTTQTTATRSPVMSLVTMNDGKGYDTHYNSYCGQFCDILIAARVLPLPQIAISSGSEIAFRATDNRGQHPDELQLIIQAINQEDVNNGSGPNFIKTNIQLAKTNNGNYKVENLPAGRYIINVIADWDSEQNPDFSNSLHRFLVVVS
jgi:hypothetical protein